MWGGRSAHTRKAPIQRAAGSRPERAPTASHLVQNLYRLNRPPFEPSLS